VRLKTAVECLAAILRPRKRRQSDGGAPGAAVAFQEAHLADQAVAVAIRQPDVADEDVEREIDDDNATIANDKTSVTADPRRPGTAYQVWDRLDLGPDGTQVLTGPAVLSGTRDFGRSWSAKGS